MKRFLFKGMDVNYNNVIVGDGIIEDDNGRMSIHTTVGWVEVFPGTVGVATGRFYDDGLPVFSGDIVNIEGFNGDYIVSYDKRDQDFKLRATDKDETYHMGDFPDTAITKKKHPYDDNPSDPEYVRDIKRLTRMLLFGDRAKDKGGMSNANKSRQEMDDNDALKFQEFIRDKNMRKVELSNEVAVRMDDGTIVFSDKM